MALPPTIPTSFVPRPETPRSSGHGSVDLGRALTLLAGFVFALAIIAAAAVFLYGQYLAGAEKSKDATLAQAESQIDQATVQSFVELQQQLSQGKTLLDQHIAYSSFFDALGALAPTTVSFSSLTLTTNADHSAAAALTGTAATFNALAALSAALATNPDIKNAIFSGIAVNKDGSVGFALSATLAPALVEMPATGAAPAPGTAAAASSTAPATP